MVISFALFLGQAFPSLAADQVLLTHTVLGTQFKLYQGSVIAIIAIMVLTTVNLRSLKMAAWLQNTTALAYIAMIAGIVIFSLLFGHGSWSHFAAVSQPITPALSLSGAGVAMIALLWSYDGWEYLSWVAGEIGNPRRNLPRALLLGILLVIITYLLANAVFLYALPPDQLARESTPSNAAMVALFSKDVGRWISLFIALICFGGASVAVLGGARIYYSMALDDVFFRGMKRIHPRWHTPVTSLLMQGAWVIALILSSRYEQLYTCFVFMMTLTYVLTVGAVFVLRHTLPDRPRPYRCAGYPWLPIAYMVVATGFTLSTLRARPREALAGLALALLGVPLYLYWRRSERRSRLQASA